MRYLVLMALLVGSLLTLSTATATSATRCSTPMRVTSPTGSRLVAGHAQRAVLAPTPEMLNRDGSISFKAPWRAFGPRGRAAEGPRGTLHIIGRRTNDDAYLLRASTGQVWQDGFAGSGMWAVVLTFPKPGCWRITGRVERTYLTFQMNVLLPRTSP